MKKGIHPEYFENAKIVCACGAAYQVGSTMPEIHVELCANCHPLYTGKQKIVDTARRVEKYQEKVAKKAAAPTGKKAKMAKRAAQKVKKAEKKEKAAKK